MELLSHGKLVKVLEPQSLIDEIKENLKSTLRNYTY
jgi:predicted DNA-binding transcriptional regulator YafY